MKSSISPTPTSVKFKSPTKLGLKDALNTAVNEYFQREHIPKTGTFKLFSKTIILFSMLVGVYCAILFSQSHTLSYVFLYPLLGTIFASIGFNVMHDAAHGSYSNKKLINELFGYSLNLVGGNVLFWKQKHNIAHHTYTNVHKHDEDIDIPGMRVHTDQEWKWYHKYQHLYWVLFYSLTYLLWIFVSDFGKYFSGRIRTESGGRIVMDTKEYVIFWISKINYLIIFVGIPWYLHGFKFAFIGFVIMSLVCGFIIATVFQLAHIVESTDNVSAENGIVKDDLTAHQMKTTSNFGTQSKVLSWFVGGLNFQVEHHLFPRISHVHYPDIMPIVKKTAQRFGIKYNEEPTLWSAIRSHVRVLKKLGQKPAVA
jgi:linoleoyl-CoA desaturase